MFTPGILANVETPALPNFNTGRLQLLQPKRVNIKLGLDDHPHFLL
jgi:hypothetical protein